MAKDTKATNGNGAPKNQTTIAVPSELMPAIEAKKASAIDTLGIKLSTSQVVHAMIRKGLEA